MLALIIPVFSVNVALAEKPIKVFVDNDKVNFGVDPIVESGVTLVEFRPIFEKLGLSIGWSGDTQTVTGAKQGLEIKLNIGNREAFIDGNSKRLRLSPRIIRGRTFIPLRFVGEASGAKVTWMEEGRNIIIEKAKKAVTPSRRSDPIGINDPRILEKEPDA